MAEEQANGVSPLQDSGGATGLTPIHSRIHCAATPDAIKPDIGNENELDSIAIDHFLETLGEVAMAIIQRRQQLNS